MMTGIAYRMVREYVKYARFRNTTSISYNGAKELQNIKIDKPQSVKDDICQ
ncbi:hypothetical protein [Nitrososphaera sp. AFS]|jgi:hypothetical protein|uniref:hypothetical protein n=1 Tax=Nitrososphaera sp. AFS TaxID=2301191 RepID=UPI0013923E6A|nr:hypothetical protein [Nitrososphaera sp. AFS]